MVSQAVRNNIDFFFQFFATVFGAFEKAPESLYPDYALWTSESDMPFLWFAENINTQPCSLEGLEGGGGEGERALFRCLTSSLCRTLDVEGSGSLSEHRLRP